MIEKGFEFELEPAAVTRSTWQQLVEKYEATVEPPPPLVISTQVMRLSGPWEVAQGEQNQIDELHVPVPDGYEFTDHNLQCYPARFSHNEIKNSGLAITEHNFIWYDHPHIGTTSDMAIREAASKAYLEKRQMRQERRARLLGELHGKDASRVHPASGSQ